MIGDHRRREEPGQLEPAVTIRRTHHGNLAAHVAQPGDAVCPLALDRSAALEHEAKFGEEPDGGIDVFDHDADVVHTLDRHAVSLPPNLLLGCLPGTAPGVLCAAYPTTAAGRRNRRTDVTI